MPSLQSINIMFQSSRINEFLSNLSRFATAAKTLKTLRITCIMNLPVSKDLSSHENFNFECFNSLHNIQFCSNYPMNKTHVNSLSAILQKLTNVKTVSIRSREWYVDDSDNLKFGCNIQTLDIHKCQTFFFECKQIDTFMRFIIRSILHHIYELQSTKQITLVVDHLQSVVLRHYRKHLHGISVIVIGEDPRGHMEF